MRKLVVIVVFSLLVFGCNKEKIDVSQNVESIQDEMIVSEVNTKKTNTDLDIMIVKGEKTEEYIIPNINNRIMGIEDDFYTTEKINTSDFFPSFGGITIALPSNIKDTENITVKLSSNDRVYTAEYSLNPFSYNDEIFGYTKYVPIENKFWDNPDGKWSITISNSQDILIEKPYENRINELCYSEISNSPLELIQERYIKKNIDYTYRFNSEKKSIVVVYFTDDDFVFYPILTIDPLESSNDKSIIIKWGNNSSSGHYYIYHYNLDELPTEEQTIPLFDSYYLN